MNPVACLLSLLFLSSPLLAADYTMGKGSTLGFTGIFQGEAFKGRFGDFQAKISYDPADLASASFDVTVHLASANTGDTDRDESLPGSDFFNITKFPTAHFVTSRFREEGGKVIAEGTLDLKGVSKPVNLEVTFAPREGGATLDVSARLNRLDFGIGSGDFADTSTIGAEVTVNAHLELEIKT
jgi:polyisoprenoid-binding protein YceI